MTSYLAKDYELATLLAMSKDENLTVWRYLDFNGCKAATLNELFPMMPHCGKLKPPPEFRTSPDKILAWRRKTTEEMNDYKVQKNIKAAKQTTNKQREMRRIRRAKQREKEYDPESTESDAEEEEEEVNVPGADHKAQDIVLTGMGISDVRHTNVCPSFNS